MRKLLLRLQSRPYHIRLMIMWLAVFVCMAFIIGIWFWSFNRSVELTRQEQIENLNEEITAPIEEFKKEVPSLWQSLGAGIKSLFEEAQQEAVQQQELELEQLESEELKPARLPEI